MTRTPAIAYRLISIMACGLGILLIFSLTFARSVPAQNAVTLSQVKKVYVEAFGQGPVETKLRERTIEELRRTGKLEIVNAPGEADAVIKGSGSIWVTGYISNDPRSPSAATQPVFRGYLSMEIVGKDGEPLWSYLVTPSKFASGDITKDLADHLVSKLAAALAQSGEIVPVAASNETTRQVALSAAGATFPAPLYQEWFQMFQERHPNLQIQYSAVGSAAGLQLLKDGKVDFAASDMPVTDQTMSQWGSTYQHFASVVGAVVPVYNLKGINRTLNFTPEVLAGIFSGKIRKWNDPAIRESNRSAALPGNDILVIHRSDGSGTTYVFTDYLSKVSPQWKDSVGSGATVDWPVGNGAEGNDGVATTVQQTPYSIGYVELAYALRHELSFGAVRNVAGQFIQADLQSVTVAASDAIAAMSSDSRVSITNASGKGAYPIASFTWWLVPENLSNGDKRTALLDLLEWILTSGQKECSALGYAPLPHEVANREMQLVTKLK